MPRKFATKEDWLVACANTVELLGSMSPSEFYNKETMEYHSTARSAVVRLANGLADAGDFGAFLQREDQTTRRLPSTPEALRGMALSDMHFRLICTFADERWMPGFLARAFNDGVLIPALEQLSANIDHFTLQE
ncbi:MULTISPECIES: hypothetical protein [Aminobacter]|uniref:Uncharacterized protein n=2 Tax=Aminobacter TaxID=31988 RepID=A0ABR6HGY4_AMIAI|nr:MULTISPECIES: hypothetical protein [Aminobacter]MBA8909784.1 hypothetical protein [Aminobacter ciceronei]MBA9023556.1 hypothetical protein [Aminobacter ciceronei]MBB3709818.1 hypothetical protein [Aminobacter aminovorans]WMC94563.1 hypothetical protein RAR13_14190 [Aminobacter aminovorans]